MNGKKKRTPKRSKGIHGGGGKVPNLTEAQRVNLGKGLYQSFRPIGQRKAEPENS